MIKGIEIIMFVAAVISQKIVSQKAPVVFVSAVCS